MDATDIELAQQPVGYWTGAGHEAVIRYINEVQGTLGVTQRHWMTLNALHRTPEGLSREGLTGELGRYMTPQIGDVSTYPAIIDDLVSKGWIAADGEGLLTMTDEGSAGRERIAVLADDIRDHLHSGVSDEDYVIALKVLQRIIANAGGT